MGYACPVCETPQRDAEHLANHLAFVAMLHGGAHRTWLDDNAPGWADEGPSELGERVAPLAPEAPHEAVFEDTVHGDGTGRPFADRPAAAPGAGHVEDGGLDEAARATLAEARELTRRMRTGGRAARPDGAGESTADDGTADAADADGAGDEKA